MGLGLALIIWSMAALRPEDRGKRLYTSGPYRWLRHPLYAAFISLMCWELALYLNSYVYLAWAAALHPLWHHLVKDEEDLIIELFGQEYRDYAARTGRFLPRLFRRR